MNGQAITFDFHNTLAECPKWFDLEVNHLPSAFLRQWSGGQCAAISEGTLTEADARYRDLRREIMDHGNELTAEACLLSVFTAMQLEIHEDEIASGVESLMRGVLAETRPIPGAVETVQAIHSAGVTIGVISSAVYHPFLEWSLEAFGIRHVMRAVITSASAGFYKSRPEIYQLAAAAVNARPARMVHVGDSLRFDVGGASRIGMGTVWLQHREPRAEEKVYMPDLTLRTLEGSAPAILRTLENHVNGPSTASA